MATHTVIASSLNLRSRPEVLPSTRIAVLSQGTDVTKLADASVPGWWEISVSLHGRDTQGFVASRFLAPVGSASGQLPGGLNTSGGKIPVVHLSKGNASVTRARDGGRAHPLGEAGMPERDGTTPTAKAGDLVDIVNYLDSPKSTHLRYKKKGNTTFCNIYAYDYCYLAGVFLPRVFWTPASVSDLNSGKTVEPRYGRTVGELNANMTHDWFEDFGDDFGWSRETDVDDLQNAANAGEVCIIVAQRRDRNRSGHILAVVPENGGHKAVRRNGKVTRPLQSQAGVVNFRFGAGSRRWWLDSKFRSFSFWRHA